MRTSGWHGGTSSMNLLLYAVIVINCHTASESGAPRQGQRLIFIVDISTKILHSPRQQMLHGDCAGHSPGASWARLAKSDLEQHVEEEMTVAALADVPVLDADPFSIEVLDDPYPFYTELREAGPIVYLSTQS